MLPYALLLGIVSLFSFSASAETNMAVVDWDRLIGKENNSRILFGVNLLGPAPYERHSATFFKPASLSKLFTTAEALEKFGPNFRIKTTLQWHPVPSLEGTISDLTLIGGGDPTWGMEEFGEVPQTRIDSLVAELKKRGVRQILGEIRVIADDPRWNRLRVPEGWNQSERLSCDGALAQAFNIQRNCSNFVVMNPKQGFWQDYGITTPVKLKIRNSGSTNLGVYETENGYEIRGTIRKFEMQGGLYFRLPVKNVDQWAKNLLLNSLRRNGITLNPAPRVKIKDSIEEPVETLISESPELQEILKPLLKNSVNMIGDALFKLAGRGSGPADQDLVTASQIAMQDFIATHIEVGPAELSAGQTTIWDGSGLSHDSRVLPTTMTKLLHFLRNRSYFPQVWEALAIAGVDGTLRERMKGTAAEGVLRAKTGTLNGTYNLAGYVPKKENDGTISDYIPFVIMTQTTSDQKAAAKAVADRVGTTLTEIVSAQPSLVFIFKN